MDSEVATGYSESTIKGNAIYALEQKGELDLDLVLYRYVAEAGR